MERVFKCISPALMRTHLTWSVKENDLIFCEKWEYPPNSNKASTLEVTKVKFWVKDLSDSPVELNMDINNCQGFRPEGYPGQPWVRIEMMNEHFVDSTLEILRDQKIDNLLNI